MASDKNADGKYQNMVVEYIKKFDDYFYYAITKKGILAADTPQCSLNTPCGSDDSFSSQCCVNAVIHNEAKNVHKDIYRCMSKGVVNANIAATVGDMKVSMKCIDSGAYYTQMRLAASAVTLAAMTLY